MNPGLLDVDVDALLPELGDLSPLERRVSRYLGLRIDGGSRQRVAEALARRMRLRGDAGADAYLRRLDTPGEAEWRELAQELSIGESYFFRARDHFDALGEVVVPQRLQVRGLDRRFRVLHAGCAAGEEPYTAALVLRDLPALADAAVEITGYDVSSALLDKARAGTYTAWSLRDVPPAVVARHFSFDGRNRYQLDPAVRAMVRFEERNLFDESQPWPQAHFDAIFCRNVLIYFTVDSIRALLRRFARMLAPGGYLFIGHSESLRGISDEFELRQSHGGFYYQLRDASRPATPATAQTVSAASGDGWIEAVRRSSERVAALSLPPPTNASIAAAPPASTSSVAAHEAALQAFRNERFAEAAALLAGDVDADPRRLDRLLLRAAALVHAGRIDEAEDSCRHVLALDTFNAEALYLLALGREHGGDLDGAMHQSQQAAYLDPVFAMPHLLTGRLARRRGRLDLARRELDRALDLIPRQDAQRVLLYGGGFGREALMQLCRAELAACRA